MNSNHSRKVRSLWNVPGSAKKIWGRRGEGVGGRGDYRHLRDSVCRGGGERMGEGRLETAQKIKMEREWRIFKTLYPFKDMPGVATL